jgi:hypothetical protein
MGTAMGGRAMSAWQERKAAIARARQARAQAQRKMRCDEKSCHNFTADKRHACKTPSCVLRCRAGNR